MNNALLQVSNLDVFIGQHQVLHDITFGIDRGQALGIVGESGSGKTTIARALTGLLARVDGRVTGGTAELGATDLLALDKTRRSRANRRGFALVPQNSMSSLDPLMSVGRQLRETVGLYEAKTDVGRRVASLLERVRLNPTPALLKSHSHELSGGMRQRIMIALALAAKPTLLIADEPTTALDVSVRSEILDLLTDLRVEEELTLLLISHDMAAIERATDRVLVMQHGRVIELGATAQVLRVPSAAYTRRLLHARPERVSPGQRIAIDQLEHARVGSRQEPAAATSSRPAVSRSGAVIRADRASMAYRGRTVLKPIDIEITESARLGIVGESGSGKSTLSRLLVGLERPVDGSVTVNDDPWHRVPRGDSRRRSVQMIQQDPYAQLTPHLTAIQAVEEAARASTKNTSQARALAEETLATTGLTRDQWSRRPKNLSGGQCQRVAIARAVVGRASILVADEPTSALDLSVQAQILNLFIDMTRSQGVGLVLISHDLAVIRHLTEELIVLYQGEIVERGRTLEVLKNPRHAYTQMLCEASTLTEVAT